METTTDRLSAIDDEIADLEQQRERERRRALIDGRAPNEEDINFEIERLETQREQARAQMAYAAEAPKRHQAFLKQEATIAPDVIEARERISRAMAMLLAELDRAKGIVTRLETTSVDPAREWVTFR